MTTDVFIYFRNGKKNKGKLPAWAQWKNSRNLPKNIPSKSNETDNTMHQNKSWVFNKDPNLQSFSPNDRNHYFSNQNWSSAPVTENPWDRNSNFMGNQANFYHQNSSMHSNYKSNKKKVRAGPDYDFSGGYEDHWDEQSLLMRENFLAGMDIDDGSISNGYWSKPRDYQNSLRSENYYEKNYGFRSDAPSFYNERTDDPSKIPPRWGSGAARFPAEKPYTSNFNNQRFDNGKNHPDTQYVYTIHESKDRKRPLNEEDAQQSLAKASRSLNQSVESSSLDSANGGMKRFGGLGVIDTVSKTQENSALSEASDIVLQKAERMCEEFKQKRKESQLQRSSALKNQSQEFFKQKMSSLVSKQKSYMKGHIKDSTKKKDLLKTAAEEQDFSGKDLASSRQSIRKDSVKSSKSSVASSTANVKAKNSLDDIRKSIEKNVLDESNNVEAKKAKNVARRGSLENQLSARVVNETREINPAVKQNPIVLTKDSLKNMINAPRSR